MAVDIRKDLDARHGLLSKSIEDIEKKMQSFPEGRINVRVRNGKTYYYDVDVELQNRSKTSNNFINFK